jgi:hypothetical protein
VRFLNHPLKYLSKMIRSLKEKFLEMQNALVVREKNINIAVES